MTQKLCLCLLLIMVQAATATELDSENSGESRWIKIKDENGIQVYSIDVADMDIVKARAVALIQAPLDKIQQQLDNIEQRPQWVPFLKKSIVLSEQTKDERIEYSLFSAPWPASDRDFIYRIKRIENKSRDTDLIESRVYKMHSIETSQMPVKEEVVRGDIFESIYSLKRINDNLTQVEITYHADPKGWLPTWIINIIQRAFPYRMMENLKNKMEKIES